MLTIKDLAVTKELDSKTMNTVVGGASPLLGLIASVRSDNKVADIDQMFKFDFDQINGGNVVNNQALQTANGSIGADVDQDMLQANNLRVHTLGNTVIR